jgi:hypothetical protein
MTLKQFKLYNTGGYGHLIWLLQLVKDNPKGSILAVLIQESPRFVERCMLDAIYSENPAHLCLSTWVPNVYMIM